MADAVNVEKKYPAYGNKKSYTLFELAESWAGL